MALVSAEGVALERVATVGAGERVQVYNELRGLVTGALEYVFPTVGLAKAGMATVEKVMVREPGGGLTEGKVVDPATSQADAPAAE